MSNNRLLSYLPTRGGLAKRRGGTLAAMKEQRFPFVPKSTGSLQRGQFWSIPLAGGGFGAGCVVGHCTDANGKVSSRCFIAGVLSWHGAEEPTASQLVGVRVAAHAFCHIKAITTSGGAVLGLANISLHGWPEAAESLSMSTWGFNFPVLLAQRLARGESAANQAFNPTATPPLRSGAAAG